MGSWYSIAEVLFSTLIGIPLALRLVFDLKMVEIAALMSAAAWGVQIGVSLGIYENEPDRFQWTAIGVCMAVYLGGLAVGLANGGVGNVVRAFQMFIPHRMKRGSESQPLPDGSATPAPSEMPDQ